MKKKLIIVTLALMSFFVAINPSHAAVGFDSTNKSLFGGTRYLLRHYTSATSCNTLNGDAYYWYSFDYVTSTQAQIDKLEFKTFANTTSTATITWTNQSGYSGSVSTTTYPTASYTTTTFDFTTNKPYSFPYGTPITFTFSNPADFSSGKYLSVESRDQTWTNEIQQQYLHCYNSDGITVDTSLTSSTYGIPPVKINGTYYAIPDTSYDLPVTSTSITATCPDFGLFTPLCDLMVWLIIPNTNQLSSQITYLKDTASTKFPFSYITSINTALTDNTDRASGTTPIVTIGLNYNTSTSFGTFMPTTWSAFSTSTVMGYLSPSVTSIFRYLMTISLYIETVFVIYYGSLRLFKPET